MKMAGPIYKTYFQELWQLVWLYKQAPAASWQATV